MNSVQILIGLRAGGRCYVLDMLMVQLCMERTQMTRSPEAYPKEPNN